jgi:hypothetical protein
LPFGRILTAALDSGDEVFALYNLGFEEWAFPLGLSAVLLFAIPPLIAGYAALDRQPRWAWFLAFLLLPVALTVVIVLIGMDSLLQSGVLDDTGVMGSPVLINLYTIAVIIGVVSTVRYLIPADLRTVPA